MRLADDITKHCGGEFDMGGMLTSLSSALQTAQKFDLGYDVIAACNHVAHSKPASIRSSLTMAKLPYERIWVEWVPQDRSDVDAPPEDKSRPVPHRIGFLAERIITESQYQITWAWSSKLGAGIMVLPLSGVIATDVDRSGLLAGLSKIASDKFSIDIINKANKMFGFDGKLPDAVEAVKAFQRQWLWEGNEKGFLDALKQESIRWDKLDEADQIALLELQANLQVSISTHAMGFFNLMNKRLPPGDIKKLRDGWEKDMEGEPLFALSFILMLNSPNALDTSRKEDLTKPNKARTAGGKRPLHEFVVTRLQLSRHVRCRSQQQNWTEREARSHLVRGHFKLRRSGVFWWSPYLWGRGRPTVERRRYEAE